MDFTFEKLKMKYIFIILFSIILASTSFAQNATFYGNITDKETSKGINDVTVFIEELGTMNTTNKKGNFNYIDIPFGNYIIQFFKEGYTSKTIPLDINQEQFEFNISLDKLNIVIEEIEVTDANSQGKNKLRNVEEFALYSAKKSEVISIESLVGNVAVNNPREVFKTITGLNIHENDAAGLQLSIGGRGLDPNRTANFNTRQNGYDISADALGYPESYYTPPVQALKRIEVVRGAASLQYGTQFGGLLNFVFKDGKKDTPFHFVSENNYGSNQLFATFNSLGGTIKKVNYYSFYNFKRGDGFRPSSDFKQHTAYAKVDYIPTDKLKIGLEYTYMDYLSQQPGGLQDFEFNADPYQSKRQRNWFQVNWNLAALNLTYEFSNRTRINTRNFFLYAGRDALGELAPINRPDPLRERDLIRGKYKNFGNETRFLHQYNINNKLSTFIIGFRYYQGFTQNQQGDASDGSAADFNFITAEPNISQYDFPSRNIALFAEHLFRITDKLNITPGIRFEHIKTASDGYVFKRIISGGEVIFEEKVDDNKLNKRNIFLTGLGLSYRLKEELELYTNFSQNYRSINFTDLAVQNPNLLVDTLLQDEKGYNFDLGIRGEIFQEKVRIDATVFALRYNNRIGITDIIVTDGIGLERVADYRTNIGDALILGLETYIETDLIQLFRKESDFQLITFSNFSMIQGKYLSGGTDIEGNNVELIPPINWKTGFTFQWKDLRSSFQYSYIKQHYSDATNAESVANATRGIIPSYSIMDFSVDYQWKWLGISTGINNLGNNAYFTRRTASYPGPGIIPAQGRNFYISLKFELEK
ncbi:MAG: Fe(3+) dicitrate transport protein [Maribacter sp.]|jgi:Fe(3+) dicitrate transport protein